MDGIIAVGGTAALTAKDLIFLAENSDKLKATVDALETRYQAIRDAKAEVEAKIALLAKAEDIDHLHDAAATAKAMADSERESARQILDGVRGEAAQIVEKARSQADQIVSDAQTAASVANAKATEDLEKAKNAMDSAAARSGEIGAREDNVAMRESRVAQAEQTVTELKADYETRMARMREIAS